MKISKSLRVATDKESAAVTISFMDESGMARTIEVPPQAADDLTLALLASPPMRRADGKTCVQRLVKPLGSETALDEDGNVRLSFRVGEAAFVHLALPREAIAILRRQLDALDAGPPPAFH